MSKPIVDLVTAAVEADGFEVIQLKNHPRHVVRVWVDREPNGVTVADCVSLTRSVRTAFSDDDLDPGEYQIEVLSPGLDRPIVREKDFERFTDRRVKVTLREKRLGRKRFQGTLVGLVDDEVVIKGDEEWRFGRHEIDEVRLVPNLPRAKPQSERMRKPRKSRRKRPKEH